MVIHMITDWKTYESFARTVTARQRRGEVETLSEDLPRLVLTATKQLQLGQRGVNLAQANEQQ